jgi:hypothetical protein
MDVSGGTGDLGEIQSATELRSKGKGKLTLQSNIRKRIFLGGRRVGFRVFIILVELIAFGIVSWWIMLEGIPRVTGMFDFLIKNQRSASHLNWTIYERRGRTYLLVVIPWIDIAQRTLAHKSGIRLELVAAVCRLDNGIVWP